MDSFCKSRQLNSTPWLIQHLHHNLYDVGLDRAINNRGREQMKRNIYINGGANAILLQQLILTWWNVFVMSLFARFFSFRWCKSVAWRSVPYYPKSQVRLLLVSFGLRHKPKMTKHDDNCQHQWKWYKHMSNFMDITYLIVSFHWITYR